MSRQFNNTTYLDGLVQKYEKAIGKDYGYVSGNTERLKEFTSSTKSAWDMYLYLAFNGDGTRQFDDNNRSKYPFIEMDLVENQRDYILSTDEEGALIIDFYKVMIKNPSGVYEELDTIDQQRKGQGASIWDGQGVTGVPTKYDKTGNSIHFDVLPNYSWRNGTEGEYGIKIFIDREASYFVYTDTTKMPGCPGIHHDYFWLRPAMEYAGDYGLDNYKTLKERVMEYEGDEEKGIKGKIEKHFSRRIKDERPKMTTKKINYI